MIQVENIQVSTAQKVLLSEVSFELHSGQHYGILGPNGAGKSTLLRVLCGELTPQRGKITWSGQALAHWKQKELAKKRAVLVQQSEINLPFTGAELLEMGRYPYFDYFPGPKDHDVIHFLCQELELAPFLNRSMSTLSGGEQQRILLGKALAQLLEEPTWEGLRGKVLLLDEPANNLDLYHQFLVLNLVEKAQQNGLTVLTVFHDLNLASRYCQHVILLKGGTIVAQGPPHNVLTTQSIFRTFHISTEIDHSGPFPQILIPSFNPIQSNGNRHQLTF